jgi:hypothetical protein
MTDADLETITTALRSTTALVRLSHGEAVSVVRAILALLAAPKTAA